jgi:hypothetical protein
VLIDGMRFSRAQIESFQKGEEYCEGPYRQWVGYTDLREGSTGASKAWDGLQREQEDSAGESEGWEGSMDGGESFIDRQDGWGASRARVRPGTVRKGGVTAGTSPQVIQRVILWTSLVLLAIKRGFL